MSAPAIASLYLGRKMESRPSDKLTEIVSSPEANLIIPTLALGEMVVDKLPFVPDRIWPPSLLSRMASGAISGQMMEAAEDRDRVFGALIGSLAAAGSSYFFYYLRRGLARRTRVPDPVLGLLEDLSVVGLGIALLNSDSWQD